jgi:hypothetical protein
MYATTTFIRIWKSNERKGDKRKEKKRSKYRKKGRRVKERKEQINMYINKYIFLDSNQIQATEMKLLRSITGCTKLYTIKIKYTERLKYPFSK